jgi:hypothetical protein
LRFPRRYHPPACPKASDPSGLTERDTTEIADRIDRTMAEEFVDDPEAE